MGERDTLSALGRLLQAPTHTPPIEKMLTPVEEKQFETDSSSSDDDDDGPILTSLSHKLDGITMSRSESGLSNPGISWTLFDVDSEVSSLRDSVSLLSDGDDTLPRGYRTSVHSVNGIHDNKHSLDDRPNILGEQEDIEHKDSSQGSDDSSAFTENSHGLFMSGIFPSSPPGSLGSFSSSAEGTPVQILSESHGRQDISSRLFDSVSPSHRRRVHVEPPSMHSRSSSRSQHTSTQSSETSQGSVSEVFESPDSTLKSSKYSRYERYERYSQTNSQDLLTETGSNRDPDVELTIEQSQSSTHSTEGSIGTLTDDIHPEDENKKVSVDDQNHVPNESDKGTLYQNGDILMKREDSESKTKTNQQSEHWELLKDIQKQLDSGIDERGSPDTRSDKSSSLQRSYLPDVINLCHKRLSHPISFNSRESGLADSPDPESLLGEPHSLNGLHSHHEPQAISVADTAICDEFKPQHQFSDCREDNPQEYEVPRPKPQYISSRDRRSKSSEPDIGYPRSHVEVMIPCAGENPTLVQQKDLYDSNDSLGSSESGRFLPDFNLPPSTSAPRNFESPRFSNIARNPIRLAESKHTRTSENPLYEASDRRPRSSSEGPPSLPEKPRTSLSPQHEPIHRVVLKTRSIASTSPTHSTSISRSTSGSDVSSHSKLALSKSLDASPSTERKIGASPSSSLKKKKWGKRLQKTFKPALRVLKITPSSAVTVNSQNDQDSVCRDIHLSSRSPDSSSPSPAEIEVGRVRMISPETVPTSPSTNLTRAMRRSQSFDDILGTSNIRVDSEPASLKVGSIRVLPETKTKSKKSKFFSSFQGNKSKTKSQRSESPAVLVEVRKKKQSGDMLAPAGDVSTKSPKTKKRSRLPHFV